MRARFVAAALGAVVLLLPATRADSAVLSRGMTVREIDARRKARAVFDDSSEVGEALGPDEEMLFGRGDEFVVATILSERDSHATHASPLRVKVRVHETLRGAVRRGIHEIEWLPPESWFEFRCGNDPAPEAPPPIEFHVCGPETGRRMILGGRGGNSGLWGAKEWARFDDTDSTRAWVIDRIRAWQPQYDSLMAWEKLERPKQEAKRRKDAAVAAARERERAAEARRVAAQKEADVRAVVAAEQARFATERAFRRGADVVRLVRTSEAIVVARVARVERRGPPWSSLELVPESWLIRSASAPRLTPETSPVIAVFGAREDSLFRRWAAMPHDDAPGSDIGRPVRVIAFLREHFDGSRSVQFASPTDPEQGLLWADDATIERVTQAVARERAGGARAASPIAACGAALAEFVTRDTVEAAGVGIRMDVTDLPSGMTRGHVLVVGASEGPRDPGWFTTCSGPESRFAVMGEGWGQNVRITATELHAVLGVLTRSTLPAIPRTGPTDPARLILRRVVDGRERVYETTLDAAALNGIGNTMESLVRGNRDSRGRLATWWWGTDPRLASRFRSPMVANLPVPAPPVVPEGSLP